MLKWFEDYKFICHIRSGSLEDAEAMMNAAAQSGLHLFEVSAHTPQAVKLIETYSRKEGWIVGAASITDGEMAQRAINAGAKFISCQYTDRDIINVVKNNDNFVIQGAFTLTEAMTAYQLGADLIKIYPADLAGGVEYIKAIRSALPFLKLVCDGDANLDQSFEYLKHCVAVTLRTAIFDRLLIRNNNWPEMGERAKVFAQRLEAQKAVK